MISPRGESSDDDEEEDDQQDKVHDTSYPSKRSSALANYHVLCPARVTVNNVGRDLRTISTLTLIRGSLSGLRR
jgi:hypothetical protein